MRKNISNFILQKLGDDYQINVKLKDKWYTLTNLQKFPEICKEAYHTTNHGSKYKIFYIIKEKNGSQCLGMYIIKHLQFNFIYSIYSIYFLELKLQGIYYYISI